MATWTPAAPPRSPTEPRLKGPSSGPVGPRADSVWEYLQRENIGGNPPRRVRRRCGGGIGGCDAPGDDRGTPFRRVPLRPDAGEAAARQAGARAAVALR